MDMEKELQKPIGGALPPMEWFVLFAFIDHAVGKDGMFGTVEDATAIQVLAKKLHDQIFPPKKDNSEEFADVIMMKPKKIITKPDIIL